MKHACTARRRSFIGTALLVAAGLASGASAEETSYPTIISTYERTAIISAADMPPGGEMWAMWVSLPTGKTVDHPGSMIGKWIDLQLVMADCADTIDESITGSLHLSPRSRCFRASRLPLSLGP